MKTDDWNDPKLTDGDWVKTDDRDVTALCDKLRDHDDFTWSCSRTEGHAGQHVATAGTCDGYEDVCWAWSA